MNQCDGSPAELCLDAYIQGNLPEIEARKFEDHYFDCPVCLEQVEALQMIAMEIAKRPLTPPKKVIAWPVRLAAIGAMAAALVLTLVGFQVMRHPTSQTASVALPPVTPAPSPADAKASASANTELASLADLSLPAYEAPHLRGSSGNAEFVVGMKAYSTHDCASAIRSLARVPAKDEDAVAAEFYAGACDLSLGKLDAAALQLQKVVSAGDSPQQEAAMYAIAQVALARGDAAAAQRELARTIALHGDFERRANVQLDRLRKIEHRQ